jgi:hypothetical protein
MITVKSFYPGFWAVESVHSGFWVLLEFLRKVKSFHPGFWHVESVHSGLWALLEFLIFGSANVLLQVLESCSSTILKIIIHSLILQLASPRKEL